MSERIGFVEEGRERIQAAFQSVEDEIQHFQQQLRERREEFEEQAEKRFKKLRRELRKSPVVKRAESIRNDVNKAIEKQFEGRFDRVLGAFQIASRADVKKLDQKLNKINRKLTALDKALSKSARATPSKPETAVAK